MTKKKLNVIDKVIILNKKSEYEEKVLQIAQKCGLKINPAHPENYEFSLSFHQGRLELSWIGKKNVKPVYVDVSQNQLKRVCVPDSLIVKAIGVKSHYRPYVLDTCAGLGTDAFTFLLLGCRVTLLERSPIIFELLINGVERLSSSFLKKLSVFQMDAIHYLDHLKEEDYPDVIYLDPMYPQRNKTALAKKEMQVLHELIGDDLDAADLLEKALKYARRRVVVKRRRLDPNLGLLKPDLVFPGKAVRFDVYLTQGE